RTVAEVGVAFRSTLIATGGQTPYRWSSPTGVPPGLNVGGDGVISGVPTRVGTYTVSVQLAEAGGGGRGVQLKLAGRARVAIRTSRLPAAAVGHHYTARIAVRGGVPRLRWTVSGLPRGLSFSARAAAISGSAAAAGTYRVKLRVRDALGASSTRVIVLRVG